ncbi:hypothetical protein KPP03845_100445 [Streptomyces xanthophaeus]|uniref:hypothetical protein n=1 Tax=Streptomyces xanthophaeus TaxID=67385 RepID=UPI00233EFD9E|nr:hypothetical protein [Streptomyces xanthophaeus]WCD84125.1 hypothetical protein KPP03845_100445 [Streptomyces xanthophaeus]
MSTRPGTAQLYGYAVVANVRREVPYGPEGTEVRSGTEHLPERERAEGQAVRWATGQDLFT